MRWIKDVEILYSNSDNSETRTNNVRRDIGGEEGYPGFGFVVGMLRRKSVRANELKNIRRMY